MSRKTVFSTLVLTGALAVPAAAAAPLRATHAAANSVTFQASVPEDAAAPAVTTVVVSNDDNGLVSFQVNLSNRPQLTNADHYYIFLDTDSNPNTGDTGINGAEYSIAVDGGRADLGKWNGSDYDYSVPQSSLVFTYAGGPVFKIAAGDLGNPTAFNFVVATASDDPAGGDPHIDFAPPAGHGSWSYAIKITPLTLSFVSLRTSPAKPKAGQPFTASMAISSSRPGVLAQGAQVTCAARLAGRALRARAQGLAASTARCSWQLPRSARGKTITGSVSVADQGLQVSHPFTARIH